MTDPIRIHALPEIPPPEVRLTPEARAALRQRIHEQLQEALRGVDGRLAQAFADFDRTGR